MHHDLLESLYAARRELTRIIVATGAQNVTADALQQLLQRRDRITWTINRILVSDLTSSLAEIDEACTAIDAVTTQLQKVTTTASDLADALVLSANVLDVATRLVGIAA
jgi:hypothetical protein